MEDVNQIAQNIQITDLEETATTLAEKVIHNLNRHKFYTPEAFPTFEIASAATSVGEDVPLAFDLQQAARAYADVWVVNTAPKTGIPIAARLRRAIHDLVVYYVNRLAERQTQLNAAMLRVLHHLVNASARTEIVALRQETAQLREELEVLRARIGNLEQTETKQ